MTTPCDRSKTASTLLVAALAALHRLRSARHRSAQHRRARGRRDRGRRAGADGIGAIADFAFAQDGDGTLFDDGHILLSGLMSDEFMLSTTPPTEQEVDQRRVFENNGTVYDMFLQPAPGPRCGGGRGRGACGSCASTPDADNCHRRDVEPGRVHLPLLRGELLLRGAVQPPGRRQRRLRRSRRRRTRCSRRRWPASTPRWPQPGVQAEERAGASSTWPPWARAGPCWTSDRSPRRRQPWLTSPPSSST